MRRTLLKNGIQLLLAAAALAACYLLLYVSVGNEFLVPSPSDVFRKTTEILGTRDFWNSFFQTLGRVFRAFAISFVFALLLALVAYLFPSFGVFVMPFVSAFRSLPMIAALLVLLKLFGAGDAPVAVAFLSLFPMLYTGILAALSGIDKQLIAASRVCGASVWRRVISIYLPLSAPYVLRESGAAVSFALKLVVSAEIVSYTADSLGGMMQDIRAYVDKVPQLFALVFVVFLTGLCLEALFSSFAATAERRVR